MKIKMELVLKETDECVLFETTLYNVKAHEFVFTVNPANDDECVYAIGGIKIWRPKGNVICAEDVELFSFKVIMSLNKLP